MEQSKKQTSSGIKVLIGLAILFFVCFIGFQLGKSGSTQTDYSSDTTTSLSKVDTTLSPTIAVTEEKPIEETSSWRYNDDEDKMTSKKVIYASVNANEELEFDMPYNGGSIATFTIRKKNGSTDIYLQVSKGQFNTSFEGGHVRLRFDENPPKIYSFSGASDGSSDIIFINSEKDVISRLKKSNKMLIEAEFFNQGNRQMEFNVSGLKWE